MEILDDTKNLEGQVYEKLIDDIDKYWFNHFDHFHIPPKFINKDVIRLIVGNNLGTNAIGRFSEEVKTYEFYKLVVSIDGTQLKYVPDIMKTEEICMISFENTKTSIKYFPLQFITFELCSIALKSLYHDRFELTDLWDTIPDNFKIYEMCKTAITTYKNFLMYLSNKSRTPELCQISFDIDYLTIMHIPPDRRTYEMCKSAFIKDYNLFKYI